MPSVPHSPTPGTPSVAVVTVSYGSAEALEPFLSSLREFHGQELPVVVVDNKPDHENVKALAQRYGASYLALPNNPGYGAGMNAGAHLLEDSVDAFFFCNPDLQFIDETAYTLARTLFENPSFGAIGPKLLNEDGTTYPSARNIPSIGTGVGHALLSRVWRSNPWTRAYQNAANYDTPRAAGSLSGAAVMVRSDLYRQLNGWDEAYFMHFEDIDLGYRVGAAGFQNRYDPRVAVFHSGAHSTKKHAEVVERAMTDSAIRFMGKRYSGRRNAPIRWLVTLGLRVRGRIRLRALRGRS